MLQRCITGLCRIFRRETRPRTEQKSKSAPKSGFKPPPANSTRFRPPSVSVRRRAVLGTTSPDFAQICSCRSQCIINRVLSCQEPLPIAHHHRYVRAQTPSTRTIRGQCAEGALTPFKNLIGTFRKFISPTALTTGGDRSYTLCAQRTAPRSSLSPPQKRSTVEIHQSRVRPQVLQITTVRPLHAPESSPFTSHPTHTLPADPNHETRGRKPRGKSLRCRSYRTPAHIPPNHYPSGVP